MNEFKFLAPDGFYRKIQADLFSQAYGQGFVPVEAQPEVSVLSPNGVLEKLYHREAADKIRQGGYQLVNRPRSLRMAGPDSRLYEVKPENISDALALGGIIIRKELDTTSPIGAASDLPKAEGEEVEQPDSPFANWFGPIPKDVSRLKNWKIYEGILEKNKQGRAGFVEGITPGVENTPFVGMAMEAVDIGKVAITANKLRKGQPVSDEDILDLNIYMAETDRQANATMLGKAGKVIADMGTFMVEVGASIKAGLATLGFGGVVLGGKAIAGRTALTAAKKAAKEAVEAGVIKNLKTGVAEGVARRITVEEGRAALKDWGVDAVEGVIRRQWGDAALNTALKNKWGNRAIRAFGAVPDLALVTAAPTIGQITPQIAATLLAGQDAGTVRDNQDKLFSAIMGEETPEGAAVWRGFGDASIENWSEAMGDYILKGFSKIPGIGALGSAIRKQTNSVFDKMVMPAAQKAAAADKVSGVNAIVPWIAKKMVDNKMSYKEAMRNLKSIGYDGVFGEMMEERAGDFVRGLFGMEGEEDDNAVLRAFKNSLPEPEQLGVELIAFSAPWAAVGGAHTLMNLKGWDEMMRTRQAFNEAAELAKNPQAFENGKANQATREQMVPAIKEVARQARKYDTETQGFLSYFNKAFDWLLDTKLIDGEFVTNPDVKYNNTMSMAVGEFANRIYNAELNKWRKENGKAETEAIPKEVSEKFESAAAEITADEMARIQGFVYSFDSTDSGVTSEEALVKRGLDKKTISALAEVGLLYRSPNGMIMLRDPSGFSQKDNRLFADAMLIASGKADLVPKDRPEEVKAVPITYREQVQAVADAVTRVQNMGPAEVAKLALEQNVWLDRSLRVNEEGDLTNEDGSPAFDRNEEFASSEPGSLEYMLSQLLEDKLTDPVQRLRLSALLTGTVGAAEDLSTPEDGTLLERDISPLQKMWRARKSGDTALLYDQLERNNKQYQVVQAYSEGGIDLYEIAEINPSSKLPLKNTSVITGADLKDYRNTTPINIRFTRHNEVAGSFEGFKKWLYKTNPAYVSGLIEQVRQEGESDMKALAKVDRKMLKDAGFASPRKEGDQEIWSTSYGAQSGFYGLEFNLFRVAGKEGYNFAEDFWEVPLFRLGYSPQTGGFDGSRLESQLGGLVDTLRVGVASARSAIARKLGEEGISQSQKNSLLAQQRALDTLPALTPGNFMNTLEFVSKFATRYYSGYEEADRINFVPLSPGFDALMEHSNLRGKIRQISGLLERIAPAPYIKAIEYSRKGRAQQVREEDGGAPSAPPPAEPGAGPAPSFGGTEGPRGTGGAPARFKPVSPEAPSGRAPDQGPSIPEGRAPGQEPGVPDGRAAEAAPETPAGRAAVEDSIPAGRAPEPQDQRQEPPETETKIEENKAAIEALAAAGSPIRFRFTRRDGKVFDRYMEPSDISFSQEGNTIFGKNIRISEDGKTEEREEGTFALERVDNVRAGTLPKVPRPALTQKEQPEPTTSEAPEPTTSEAPEPTTSEAPEPTPAEPEKKPTVAKTGDVKKSSRLTQGIKVRKKGQSLDPIDAGRALPEEDQPVPRYAGGDDDFVLPENTATELIAGEDMPMRSEDLDISEEGIEQASRIFRALPLDAQKTVASNFELLTYVAEAMPSIPEAVIYRYAANVSRAMSPELLTNLFYAFQDDQRLRAEMRAKAETEKQIKLQQLRAEFLENTQESVMAESRLVYDPEVGAFVEAESETGTFDLEGLFDELAVDYIAGEEAMEAEKMSAEDQQAFREDSAMANKEAAKLEKVLSKMLLPKLITNVTGLHFVSRAMEAFQNKYGVYDVPAFLRSEDAFNAWKQEQSLEPFISLPGSDAGAVSLIETELAFRSYTDALAVVKAVQGTSVMPAIIFRAPASVQNKRAAANVWTRQINSSNLSGMLRRRAREITADNRPFLDTFTALFDELEASLKGTPSSSMFKEGEGLEPLAKLMTHLLFPEALFRDLGFGEEFVISALKSWKRTESPKTGWGKNLYQARTLLKTDADANAGQASELLRNFLVTQNEFGDPSRSRIVQHLSAPGFNAISGKVGSKTVYGVLPPSALRDWALQGDNLSRMAVYAGVQVEGSLVDFSNVRPEELEAMWKTEVQRQYKRHLEGATDAFIPVFIEAGDKIDRFYAVHVPFSEMFPNGVPRTPEGNALSPDPFIDMLISPTAIDGDGPGPWSAAFAQLEAEIYGSLEDYNDGPGGKKFVDRLKRDAQKTTPKNPLSFDIEGGLQTVTGKNGNPVVRVAIPRPSADSGVNVGDNVLGDGVTAVVSQEKMRQLLVSYGMSPDEVSAMAENELFGYVLKVGFIAGPALLGENKTQLIKTSAQSTLPLLNLFNKVQVEVGEQAPDNVVPISEVVATFPELDSANVTFVASPSAHKVKKNPPVESISSGGITYDIYELPPGAVGTSAAMELTTKGRRSPEVSNQKALVEQSSLDAMLLQTEARTLIDSLNSVQNDITGRQLNEIISRGNWNTDMLDRMVSSLEAHHPVVAKFLRDEGISALRYPEIARVLMENLGRRVAAAGTNTYAENGNMVAVVSAVASDGVTPSNTVDFVRLEKANVQDVFVPDGLRSVPANGKTQFVDKSRSAFGRFYAPVIGTPITRVMRRDNEFSGKGGRDRLNSIVDDIAGPKADKVIKDFWRKTISQLQKYRQNSSEIKFGLQRQINSVEDLRKVVAYLQAKYNMLWDAAIGDDAGKALIENLPPNATWKDMTGEFVDPSMLFKTVSANGETRGVGVMGTKLAADYRTPYSGLGSGGYAILGLDTKAQVTIAHPEVDNVAGRDMDFDGSHVRAYEPTGESYRLVRLEQRAKDEMAKMGWHPALFPVGPGRMLDAAAPFIGQQPSPYRGNGNLWDKDIRRMQQRIYQAFAGVGFGAVSGPANILASPYLVPHFAEAEDGGIYAEWWHNHFEMNGFPLPVNRQSGIPNYMVYRMAVGDAVLNTVLDFIKNAERASKLLLYPENLGLFMYGVYNLQVPEFNVDPNKSAQETANDIYSHVVKHTVVATSNFLANSPVGQEWMNRANEAMRGILDETEKRSSLKMREDRIIEMLEAEAADRADEIKERMKQAQGEQLVALEAELRSVISELSDNVDSAGFIRSVEQQVRELYELMRMMRPKEKLELRSFSRLRRFKASWEKLANGYIPEDYGFDVASSLSKLGEGFIQGQAKGSVVHSLLLGRKRLLDELEAAFPAELFDPLYGGIERSFIGRAQQFLDEINAKKLPWTLEAKHRKAMNPEVLQLRDLLIGRNPSGGLVSTRLRVLPEGSKYEAVALNGYKREALELAVQDFYALDAVVHMRGWHVPFNQLFNATKERIEKELMENPALRGNLVLRSINMIEGYRPYQKQTYYELRVIDQPNDPAAIQAAWDSLPLDLQLDLYEISIRQNGVSPASSRGTLANWVSPKFLRQRQEYYESAQSYYRAMTAQGLSTEGSATNLALVLGPGLGGKRSRSGGRGLEDVSVPVRKLGSLKGQVTKPAEVVKEEKKQAPRVAPAPRPEAGKPKVLVPEKKKTTPEGKVLLTGKSPYLAKDQAKSDKANKFIGAGSEKSSTEQYRKDWGDAANSGSYSSSDVVFVSAEGDRKGRRSPPFAELRRAIEAGATFITDIPQDRVRNYNVGEREVSKFLTKNGYREVEPGTWRPAAAAEVAPPVEQETKNTFEIVSDKGQYDVLGMRVGGSHMNNTEPGEPGWLGNPYKWSGNRGPKNVKKEQATDAFRKDFMAKLESNPAFRQAVLNLRGKKVGYYRPQETDTHIRVVQEVLRGLPAAQAPAPATRETPPPIGPLVFDSQYSDFTWKGAVNLGTGYTLLTAGYSPQGAAVALNVGRDEDGATAAIEFRLSGNPKTDPRTKISVTSDTGKITDIGNAEKIMGKPLIDAAVPVVQALREAKTDQEMTNAEAALGNWLTGIIGARPTAAPEAEVETVEAPAAEEAPVQVTAGNNADILTARVTPIAPTEDQRNMLMNVKSFLEDPKEQATKIVGYAGTGKTTFIPNIVNYAKATGKKVLVWAPTNRATNILTRKLQPEGVTAEISTVHSSLYGEPDATTGEWVPKQALTSDSLILVDESSMVEKQLFEDIMGAVKAVPGAKVIFIGDSYQLEPVGQDSKVLSEGGPISEKYATLLTKVMRQASDSDVLSLATHIRNTDVATIPSASTDQITVHTTENNFEQAFVEAIRENPESTVMIVATNRKRVRYNRTARMALFTDAKSNSMLPGETLVSIANSSWAANGESMTVTDPGSVTHRFNVSIPKGSGPNRQMIKVPIERRVARVQMGDKIEQVTLYFTPDAEVASVYHGQITQNADREVLDLLISLGDAGFNKRNQLKMSRSIGIVTYGYALTAHKSQGGEWADVFVQQEYVAPGWNRGRWLYTAITRTSDKLNILRNGTHHAQNPMESIREGVISGAAPTPDQRAGMPEDIPDRIDYNTEFYEPTPEELAELNKFNEDLNALGQRADDIEGDFPTRYEGDPGFPDQRQFDPGDTKGASLDVAVRSANVPLLEKFHHSLYSAFQLMTGKPIDARGEDRDASEELASDFSRRLNSADPVKRKQARITLDKMAEEIERVRGGKPGPDRTVTQLRDLNTRLLRNETSPYAQMEFGMFEPVQKGQSLDALTIPEYLKDFTVSGPQTLPANTNPDWDALLREARESAASPVTKVLIDRVLLSPNLKKLRSKDLLLMVNQEPAAVSFTNELVNKKTLGLYDADAKTIEVFAGNIKEILDNSGLAFPAYYKAHITRTMVHEYVHDITYNLLRQDPGFNSEISELLKFTKESGYVGGGEYGLKNNDEFLSELFSNPDFQRKLMRIEYPQTGKSVWQSIVDAIKNALRRFMGGAEVMPETALTAAVESFVKAANFAVGPDAYGLGDPGMGESTSDPYFSESVDFAYPKPGKYKNTQSTRVTDKDTPDPAYDMKNPNSRINRTALTLSRGMRNAPLPAMVDDVLSQLDGINVPVYERPIPDGTEAMARVYGDEGVIYVTNRKAALPAVVAYATQVTSENIPLMNATLPEDIADSLRGAVRAGFAGKPTKELWNTEVLRRWTGAPGLFADKSHWFSVLADDVADQLANHLPQFLKYGRIVRKGNKLALGVRNTPRELAPAERELSPNHVVPWHKAIESDLVPESLGAELQEVISADDAFNKVYQATERGEIDDKVERILRRSAYETLPVIVNSSEPNETAGRELAYGMSLESTYFQDSPSRIEQLKSMGVPAMHLAYYEMMNEVNRGRTKMNNFLNTEAAIFAYHSPHLQRMTTSKKGYRHLDARSPKTALTKAQRQILMRYQAAVTAWMQVSEKFDVSDPKVRENLMNMPLIVHGKYRPKFEDRAGQTVLTTGFGAYREGPSTHVTGLPELESINEVLKDFNEQVRPLLLDPEKGGRTEKEIDLFEAAKRARDMYNDAIGGMNEAAREFLNGRDYLAFRKSYAPQIYGWSPAVDPDGEMADRVITYLMRNSDPADTLLKRPGGGVDDSTRGKHKAKIPAWTDLQQELLRVNDPQAYRRFSAADEAPNVVQANRALLNAMRRQVYDSAYKHYAQSDAPGDWQPNERERQMIATMQQLIGLLNNYKFVEYSAAEFPRAYETYADAYLSTEGALRPKTMNYIDLMNEYAQRTYAAAANKAIMNAYVTYTDQDGRPLVMAKPSKKISLTHGVISEEAWRQWSINMANYYGDKFDPRENVLDEARRLYDKYASRVHAKQVVTPKLSAIEEFRVTEKYAGKLLKKLVQVSPTETNLLAKAALTTVAWTKQLSVSWSMFFHIALTESGIAQSGPGKTNLVWRGLKALAGKVSGRPEMGESFRNFWKDVRAFRELRRYYDPDVAADLDYMLRMGMTTGRTAALDQYATMVERQVASMSKWAEETFGKRAGRFFTSMMFGTKEAAGPLSKFWPGLTSKKLADWMFTWFSAFKEAQMHELTTKLAIEEGYNTESARLVPWNKARHIAKAMDDGLGGQNWHRYLGLTPLTMFMWTVLMFAPNWTLSAWNASGIGLLTAGLIRNYYAPGQLRFIWTKYMPAMALWVMHGIPAAMQAASYAIGQVFGGDDDDVPLPYMNEPGRKGHIDVTPILRNSPFYKGDPTGQRRIYIQFAKQVHETGVLNPLGTRGWINEPGNQFMRKLTMPAKIIYEQMTGQSPGSDYTLEFSGAGLMGLIHSGEPGIKGFTTSRLGYIAQKVTPMSGMQFITNPEVFPYNYLAPTSRGSSQSKLTKSIANILSTYASQKDWHRIRQVPGARAKLESLVPEYLEAARVNGYNPDKILTTAKGMALGPLYRRMWQALDSGDTATMNEVAASIFRVGGTVRGLERSFANRENTYGKTLPPEIKQKAVDALEQAYNGQF